MPALSTSYPPSPTAADSRATDVLDLSVIIVNYNVREFLEQTLRSVERASRDLRVEVFVVDNNSVDGSVQMVRTHFPEVRLIANETNAGFGAANNQAIRQARGRHLLILNPDTIVQEDTFSTLLRFMDTHPDAGAVGCKILNPDGTFAPESRRAFPSPSVALYRVTGLSRLFPKSPTFGRYNLTYLPEDEVAEVDALSGSCMLVRHAALYEEYGDGGMGEWEKGSMGEQEHGRTGDGIATQHNALPSPPPILPSSPGAGLFDEDFFMYGEDLDWCYRIQQAGWKVYYTPDTQIIHYKGESTKKGELRYVRLFYGAMLQFTQKHLEMRYANVLAWGLRVSILGRAALSVVSQTLRRLAAPLLDFALTYAAVALVALARTAFVGGSASPLFFLAVAPGFAFGTVATIALVGGYRRERQDRVRSVLAGVAGGLLLVAALSFFVKSIAFSRAILLLSVPLAALLLSVPRLVRRSRRAGTRRALLVGDAAEAERLAGMLHGQPHPPFLLIGYVTPADETVHTPGVPHLGVLRHLRDLVRLRRVDDVIFAARDLSNQTIFALIQRLHDLPVQFKMLGEGQDCIIGKASISDLSAPAVVEAEAAMGPLRSPGARRALEWAVALPLLLLHPLLAAWSRLTGADSFAQRLAARTRQMPAVLRGDRALIGYHPGESHPPPDDWGLRPGVFYIRDLTPSPRMTDAVHPAYWRYARHQSLSLDWDLLVRSVLNLRHRHG